MLAFLMLLVSPTLVFPMLALPTLGMLGFLTLEGRGVMLMLMPVCS